MPNRTVTCVGGGTGLPRVLRAVTGLPKTTTTAVVNMVDDGGSSGVIRESYGFPPPGDVRNCLAALATEHPLTRLFDYRFSGGFLDGHSLGNLALLALADAAPDRFEHAVDEAAALLGLTDRVIPVTTDSVWLRGRTAHDAVMYGQWRIARTMGVEEVWLHPSDVTATQAAIDAIHDADWLVLAPGSLYTSIIPTLLFPQVQQALAERRGSTLMVGCVAVQYGETMGYSAADHISALVRHIPTLTLDAVVLHESHDDAHEQTDLAWVENDVERVREFTANVILEDVVEPTDPRRHSATKLRTVLANVLGGG